MSPLDAVFLQAEDEDPATSMAIASIAIFEGKPPAHDQLLRQTGARLVFVPRYRQRVLTPWLELGTPVWVDDPHFDLGFHIRRTALPAPGDDDALFRLMGRVMAQRLDRTRPLWEIWVVEGLERGRWAIISKVHHCMVDGVSGTEVYHLLLSPTPAVDPPVEAEPWAPDPLPSTLSVTVDAVRQIALSPVRQLALARDALRRPGRAWQRGSDIGRGLLALSASARPVAASSLCGPVGQQRRYAATTVSLSRVRDIAHAHGVTINDVALAAATGGFRALLLARGDRCEPTTVRSLVPVSVRAPGEEGVPSNKVSCLLADLPVHLDDPLARLAAMHAHLLDLKNAHEADAGVAVTELAAREPFPLVAPLVRAVMHVPQHSVVTVTTNVPGPREPLYLLGRQLLRLCPYVPIAARVRVGVAILSYCDELTFGVTGDYDTADATLVVGEMARAVDELAAATPTSAAASA